MPDDAEFQLDVMRAAFGLLSSATEPTIEDYPTDAPGAAPEAWACPVNLAPPPDDSLQGQLLAEVAGLRPWAAETRRRRGRTLFGLSGAAPDQVDEVARALAALATTDEITEPPPGDISWSHPMPLLVRHLADDLRSYYHEAIAAQPGTTPPDHDALNHWIFSDTVFGKVLMAIGDRLTDAGDTNPLALIVRNFVIPEGHYRGISNFADIPGGYQRGDTRDA